MITVVRMIMTKRMEEAVRTEAEMMITEKLFLSQ
jgi:hypothetical protein